MTAQFDSRFDRAVMSRGISGRVTASYGGPGLVCDVDGTATGNSVLVDSELVPLSLQGDADFTGDVVLDPVCVSDADIAFLIRTASGAWIAAGAVRVGP